ncbi:MAG: hypothetical protein AAF840_18750, partial [Bacteroidota bacterium]
PVVTPQERNLSPPQTGPRYKNWRRAKVETNRYTFQRKPRKKLVGPAHKNRKQKTRPGAKIPRMSHKLSPARYKNRGAKTRKL